MTGRFTSETAAEAGRKGGASPKRKKAVEDRLVMKSYRLPPEVITMIEDKAKARGITSTELIIRAVFNL